MKKLAFLFLSVLALGITTTSCSSDDKDSKPASSSIVGKWEFSTMDGKYGTEDVPVGTPELFWADPNCTDGKSYWEFEGTDLHLGVRFSGETNCELQSYDFKYTVNSAKTTLTVTFPDDSQASYPIVKLTATELDWREQDGEGDQGYNIVHHMVKKS